MLRAKYLENSSWRCYLASIANRIVCCEAVRSAILATALLLVAFGYVCYKIKLTILSFSVHVKLFYRIVSCPILYWFSTDEDVVSKPTTDFVYHDLCSGF